MCPIAPPEGRFGDLLPLPLPALPSKPSGPCHRATVRRHQREALQCRAERESVAALNRSAGFSEPSLWPSFSRNSAQDSSLETIHRIHGSRRFPKGSTMQPWAALSKLLRAAPGYGQAAGVLAPYEDGKVSLPSDQKVPCALSEALGPEERKRFVDFETQVLLDLEQRARTNEDTDVSKVCYHDPLLANGPHAWAIFVASLFEAGVVDFISNPKLQLGCFSYRISRVS